MHAHVLCYTRILWPGAVVHSGKQTQETPAGQAEQTKTHTHKQTNAHTHTPPTTTIITTTTNNNNNTKARNNPNKQLRALLFSALPVSDKQTLILLVVSVRLTPSPLM